MNSFFQFYKAESDERRASWVAERCVGPKHTLHQIMPSGFEYYIRICHPAWSLGALDSDERKAWSELVTGPADPDKFVPIRWDEVATSNGHVPYRLMQWYQIDSSTIGGKGLTGIQPPLEGVMTIEMIENMFGILAGHGGADQEVLCGFWEGYNLPQYSQVRAKFKSHPVEQNYLLFSSTLSKVTDAWLTAHEQVVRRYQGFGMAGLVPNAIWPTTSEWYLATPYNLRSSYFGGSTDLVKKITSIGLLETYTALPGDDIYLGDARQDLS